jgi:uncharacterized membrane protein
MTRKFFIIQLLLLAAEVAATVLLYPHLADRVATHWGWKGQPNGFSPKSMLWLFGPGMLVFITALAVALPWLSPRHFTVDGFRSTYQFIMTSLSTMCAYIYGLMLWAGSGHGLDVGRAIVGGACLFVAVMGNVLSKVRRNFYLGVRTPWTLTNERVWYSTHRFAAKVFVIAGLLGLAMAVAGLEFAPIVMILVGALAPALYSLVYYKQLQRRGEL